MSQWQLNSDVAAQSGLRQYVVNGCGFVPINPLQNRQQGKRGLWTSVRPPQLWSLIVYLHPASKTRKKVVKEVYLLLRCSACKLYTLFTSYSVSENSEEIIPTYTWDWEMLLTKHPFPSFNSDFGEEDGSGGKFLLFNMSYSASGRICNSVYEVP